MSRKRFRALIAAVLLVLTLTISTAPPAVLASECGSTASGCS